MALLLLLPVVVAVGKKGGRGVPMMLMMIVIQIQTPTHSRCDGVCIWAHIKSTMRDPTHIYVYMNAPNALTLGRSLCCVLFFVSEQTTAALVFG